MMKGVEDGHHEIDAQRVVRLHILAVVLVVECDGQLDYSSWSLGDSHSSCSRSTIRRMALKRTKLPLSRSLSYCSRSDSSAKRSCPNASWNESPAKMWVNIEEKIDSSG